MYKLIFHPYVFYDVRESYDWYENESSGLGERFLLELENAYHAISIHPLYWAPYSVRFRWFLLKRFPFGVIYRVEKQVIYIVAVAHLSRKPGFWKKRKFD